MRSMPERSDVQAFILSQVSSRSPGIAASVARTFGISRQAANRHIASLVANGLLVATGRTRNRTYELALLGRVVETVPITSDLEEDALWRRHVAPLLHFVPDNVRDICNYGFTEMVNNAKDHSDSDSVTFAVDVTGVNIIIGIQDSGVGIFTKIRKALNLDDDRHAIFELVKGKITTDPARHTGEGIFFTSRMFDQFGITSGRLSLARLRESNDYLVEETKPFEGTWILMMIATGSDHTSREIFDRYALSQDDYAFQRTHVVVSLAETEGASLVSRSQAKRIVARLDRFKEVVLDFNGIPSIGPAFADEIFRVFTSSHPAVHLRVMNASAEVQKMIRRAEDAATR